MSTTYQILLIEDEPEKWNSFFNQTTAEPEKDSLLVINVNSLKEGEDYISQNHKSLDAVLIEYNFPNISPKEVLEAIPWMKRNYSTLPVFILCANPASEDIAIITSFIKAGAVNYFNISNFKPAYLAAHLCAARENRKIINQYDIVTSISSENPKNKPCLIINKNDYSVVSGTFAFSLEAVKRPRSDKEESEFMEYSEYWHREFFRMLAILIDEKVTLTIKFNCPPIIDSEEPLKVGVYWQFKVSAIDLDELKKEYEKTIRDINLYLGAHSLFPDNPYVFTAVTDIDRLKQLNAQQDFHKYHVKRKTVECSGSLRQVGFKKHTYPQVKSRLSVFKRPDDWTSINTFCKIMVQEENYTQFEISILPYQLNVTDKEEASKWASGLPDNFPLQVEEITLYKKFLEGLSHSTFRHFIMTFQFYSPGPVPDDAIKAALLHAFALEHFENGQPEKQDALFADIYPDYSLPMFCRMPLPQKEGIPGINTVPQNMLFFPANISNKGVIIGHKRMSVGKTSASGIPDLSQHAYILGQTGTGKSTMLYTMVMDLLASGKHVSLIDPHGDLYDNVVRNMPESCRANSIFFDPSASFENIPGINFLSHDRSDPYQKSYLLNALYTILESLYDMKLAGGPIFIKCLHASMRLVMENQGTILDIIRVFENSGYRDKLLESTIDRELKAEWNEILSSTGETSFVNLSVYITSKLNEFRNNIFLREILGSKENQLDFSDIMNNGKNLFIRLPVGVLGERGVDLVGQIIFNKFLMTAFAREKMMENQRLDHFLVIDEFHKFTTDALGKVFSEARKYHLSLIVANQTFSQLKYDVQHILLGNVGTMLFFRPGINHAELVARYFEPDFTAGELCSLPNYQCAARISIDHWSLKPFVFETIREPQ